MRILHIISGLDTGGAELFLERLLGELNGGEFHHAVVSLSSRGTISERLTAKGVEVCDLNLSGPAGVVRLPWRVAHEIRKWQPDLIQGWLYHGNLATCLGTWAAGTAVPVLWNIRHSLDQWSNESLGLRAEIRVGGWLSGTPQRIVYNSARSAMQHERLGYPGRKTCIIPNGFDVARFQPDPATRDRIRAKLGFASGTIVIGMFGRFHPLKGHESCLRAMRVVADAVPEARLVMAGARITRDNRELMKLIGSLELERNVMMLGARDDIPDLLNALDIYVSASLSEGFPNAVGEAMSCGVPCAVTDAGDSAALVGETGKVVPTGNSNALAQAMLGLINIGERERLRLGHVARLRIVNNYSNAAIAGQYRDLYRDVANNAQSPK